MYLEPGEWSNVAEPRAAEARSIGSILGEMREIAALRAGRSPRSRAVRAARSAMRLG